MITWLITFIFFIFFFIAMAVGLLISKKTIKGSCGGLQNLGLKDDCAVCGKTGNKKTCKKLTK